MRPRYSVNAALLLLLVARAWAAPTDSPDLDARLEARVDAYLAPYLDTGNFSGSILIGQRGRVLFSKGYGFSNREHSVPNTPGSVFHLASTSRVFTATAAMLLIQDERLRLDDPLAKHLPGFPNGNRISIHHLLTLSGGFPNVNSLPGYDEWSLAPQTPASMVERFKDLPLDFAPGERSVHSNSNYNILALLIERLSGVDFGEFLEREIFTPNGMSQSGHHGDPSRVIPHRAAGYTPAGVAGFVNAPWLDWSVKTGHASLYSTVEDLYRFDRALVEGGLLEPASLQRVFTEHFENNGYGWFVRSRFGDRELYINGRSPGFGSYFGRLETQDLTVIVLGNLYNSQPTTIARDLMAIVLGEAYDPPGFSATPIDPGLLAELVGNYRFGEDFYSANARYAITGDDGHLMANGDWLMPAGPMRFIHRIYGSELQFQRDADGRVTALIWDGFHGDRIGPSDAQ